MSAGGCRCQAKRRWRLCSIWLKHMDGRRRQECGGSLGIVSRLDRLDRRREEGLALYRICQI